MQKMQNKDEKQAVKNNQQGIGLQKLWEQKF
jgi:hypothetical protein